MNVGDTVAFFDENGHKQIGSLIKSYPHDFTVATYKQVGGKAVTSKVHFITKQQIKHNAETKEG